MGLLDGWRLCPRCGHELEGREHGHLGCPACGSEYYANSAPAVQGVLERDGRVLLAKRALEPRRGHWDLPGGFLEEGEQPSTACDASSARRPGSRSSRSSGSARSSIRTTATSCSA